jgi:hypothetical protein
MQRREDGSRTIAAATCPNPLCRSETLLGRFPEQWLRGGERQAAPRPAG